MSNVAIDLTKTVKEIITTMKTAIDNLNSDVAANKTAIDNLNTNVDSLKSEVEGINTPVYYLDSDGCLCEKIFVEVNE
jgi:hypothetical protein